MARIAGVDLPNEKRVEYGLTYVYGIGVKSSNKILAEAGINPDTRVKDLTEDELAKIREIIDRDYTVEGDLRRQVALDIKRLIEIGCYRKSNSGRDIKWLLRSKKLVRDVKKRTLSVALFIFAPHSITQ